MRFFSSCSSSSPRDELVSPLPSVPSVELVQGNFNKKGGGGGGGVFFLRTGLFNHGWNHPLVSRVLRNSPSSATLLPLGSYSASVH